jgi:hypothetical protein
MRAKTRADPAVAANNRSIGLFVKIDCLHNACGLAFAASYAFIFLDKHASARPGFQSVAGAYFHAGRLLAPQAYDRNEAACQPANGMHPYRAFYQ